jgi:hypothetical protein
MELTSLKKRPRRTPHSFHHSMTLWEGTICESGNGLLWDTRSICDSVLHFPASRTGRHKFLLIHHVVHGILLEQLEWTNTEGVRVLKRAHPLVWSCVQHDLEQEYYQQEATVDKSAKVPLFLSSVNICAGTFHVPKCPDEPYRSAECGGSAESRNWK